MCLCILFLYIHVLTYDYSGPLLIRTAPYLAMTKCVQIDEFVQIAEGLLNQRLNGDNLYIMRSDLNRETIS